MPLQSYPLEYHSISVTPLDVAGGQYHIRTTPPCGGNNPNSFVVTWVGGSTFQSITGQRNMPRFGGDSALANAKIIDAIKHKLKELGHEPNWHAYRYDKIPLSTSENFMTYRVKIVPEGQAENVPPMAVALVAIVLGENSEHAIEVQSWLTRPTEWNKWDEEAQNAVLEACMDLIM